MSFGGITGPNLTTAQTESWNGSAWSEEADINTARRYLNNYSCGTSTSALGIGGDVPKQLLKQNHGMELVGLKQDDMSVARTGSSTACADNG